MDLSPKTTTYATGDNSWLGSAHGTDATQTITLDVSAFTEGTHFPDGYIKSGQALSKITATGLYGPYTPAGAGGLETLSGFLYGDTAVTAGGSDVGAAILLHGQVKGDRLPIAVDADGQADVAGRILFR